MSGRIYLGKLEERILLMVFVISTRTDEVSVTQRNKLLLLTAYGSQTAEVRRNMLKTIWGQIPNN